MICNNDYTVDNFPSISFHRECVGISYSSVTKLSEMNDPAKKRTVWSRHDRYQLVQAVCNKNSIEESKEISNAKDLSKR